MGFYDFVFAWLLVQVLMWGVAAIDCKSSEQFTIGSAKDVTEINKCTTFNGSIIITADAPEYIDLDGPKSIAGSLKVAKAKNLRSLSSNSLKFIDTMILNSLPQLSTLDFPAINNFSSLQLVELPSLDNFTFASGKLEADIESIIIFNTSLHSLEWLHWPVHSELNISSNPNLEAFEITYDTIDSALKLEDNPSLTNVNVSAVSNVQGSFDLSGNSIETLAFDNLETIGGSIHISGAYTNISMSALKKVAGSLHIKSTKDISGFCDSLGQKSLTGHYDCSTDSPSSPPTSPTSTDTPSTSPTPSSATEGDQEGGFDITLGAKIGIIIGAIIFALFLATGVFFCYRARSRGKVREIIPASAATTAPTSPKSGFKDVESVSTAVSARNVEAGAVRLELNGKEMHEAAPGPGTGMGMEVENKRKAGGNLNVGGESGREASLNSVSSSGSQVSLLKHA
ncbi:cell wall protein Ecm33 [Kalmusia sp. IMI 367209]|nr:cell wall protein Ecm33 [Kalmusia sp. IMI 367209]